jgi:alpha-beta hydrolase superfamily lysophospholipase
MSPKFEHTPRVDPAAEPACSRRAVLAGTGAFVAGAMVSPARAEGADALWSGEYSAAKERNGKKISLAIYRKRLGPPQPGEPARPVLFLVHGSSISALSAFDLTVPGKGEYSLMNVFARYGFDVWTMDHENYGRSARTEGNSDIASGVQDLAAASRVVARETGQSRPHFMGESSGALRAGAFAAAEPDRVGRLVLSAFTWTGKNSPTLQKRAEQVEFFRAHNMRPRGRDMIRSIFTRDKPGTSDPAVAEAMADAELKFGDAVPTGTYLDMTANLPVVDPTKVLAPVLLIRGEHDGIASLEDLLAFYQALSNPDRQFVIMPGAAHSIAFGLNREQFWHVMHAFLAMPPRADT